MSSYSRQPLVRFAAVAAALTLVGAIGHISVPRAQSSGYDAAFFKALKWRNVGPLRGGRSIASAGSPSRIHEYYFGAVGGGLWKTIDGGQTWNPVTDGQIKSSSVGAVAVAEPGAHLTGSPVWFSALQSPCRPPRQLRFVFRPTK